MKDLKMYRKNNVLAARVELMQVSEVAGDFETATPLTFNRYSAYLHNSTLAAKTLFFDTY